METRYGNKNKRRKMKFLKLTIVAMFLLTSCASYKYNKVKESTPAPKHKCELMEQGKRCLADHSCCKK